MTEQTGLKVIDPGLWTTVQDAGRPGFREWGVPLGGACDRDSADLANALLGNGPECALIEMTLRGGKFLATSSLGLALAGAPMEASVEGSDGRSRTLRLPLSFTLRRGERLDCGPAIVGARAYLAVVGGFLTPARLGSRSTEGPVTAGQVLPALPGSVPTRYPGGASLGEILASPFRLLDGPDCREVLAPRAWEGAQFRVGSRSDRMGLRLEGEALATSSAPDRLSAPVAPGTVQLAGGQLILLGVASGTMGGYPHIGQICSADLDRMGQLRPGDRIRFVRVTLAEARAFDRAAERARRERRVRLVALAGDPGAGHAPTRG